MPHYMDTSVLLQTEMLCTPTQWIVIDTTNDARYFNSLEQHGRASNMFFDVLDWSRFVAHDSNLMGQDDAFSAKSNYIKNRPKMLKTIHDCYEARIKQGTKGRLTIWIISDLSSTASSLLLQELPLDISNYCHWRHRFVPAVVRIAIGDPAQQVALTSLMQYQYFKMPMFEGEKEDLKAKRGSNSQPDEWEEAATVSDSPEPTQVAQICANQYDTLLLSSQDAHLHKVFEALLPLHSQECRYTNKKASNSIGSGGQLSLIEQQLVTSVSVWRRVDWLALAQVAFMPRLWRLDEPSVLNEFISLLDYRAWVGRFSQLQPGESLVPYSDSTQAILDDMEKSSFKRRKRERGWRHLASSDLGEFENSQQSVGSSQEDDVTGSDATNTLMLLEENQWRITSSDFATFRELITCLHRTRCFESAYEALALVKSAVGDIPADFIKLEGLIKLKLGQPTEGRSLLRKYRETILKQLEDNMLLDRVADSEQARVWSEAAASALVDGDFLAAREHALKAIQLDHISTSACKTLVWASVKTGVSSLEQEDIIFSFFMNHVRDDDRAQEYYTLCTKNNPTNPYYHYAYARYLQLSKKDFSRASTHYSQARLLLPDNARVLESVATFKFQTRWDSVKNDDSELSSIEEMYRTSLSQDENVITKGNFAGCLLAVGKAEQRDEAFRLLDAVIYDDKLTKMHYPLVLECWFYVLCYCDTQSKFQESLQQIKTYLRLGVRAIGWNFSMHLPYAKKNSIVKEEYEWIVKLSTVLTWEHSLSTLRDWSLWKATTSDRHVRSASTLLLKTSNTEVISTQPPTAPASASLKTPTFTKSYSKSYSKAKRTSTVLISPDSKIVVEELNDGLKTPQAKPAISRRKSPTPPKISLAPTRFRSLNSEFDFDPIDLQADSQESQDFDMDKENNSPQCKSSPSGRRAVKLPSLQRDVSDGILLNETTSFAHIQSAIVERSASSSSLQLTGSQQNTPRRSPRSHSGSPALGSTTKKRKPESPTMGARSHSPSPLEPSSSKRSKMADDFDDANLAKMLEFDMPAEQKPSLPVKPAAKTYSKKR